MRVSEMLKFKYQILVDGNAAAWDSSFWKLSSGSTVFYLLPLSDSSTRQQVSGCEGILLTCASQLGLGHLT